MPVRSLAEQCPRVAAEDKIARGRCDIQRLDARDTIEVAHVERIVAAEQHAIRPDTANQKFERRLRMKDGVVDTIGRATRRAAP